MNTESLDTLLHWFDDHGVIWDQHLLVIRHADGTTGPALGVFAKHDIPTGRRLCLIPKSAVLSPRNVAIANALEEAQIGQGGLSLNIAIMHELAHGPASPWHGYLQALPHREHLPVFWSDQQLQHLKGCALRGSVEADRVHMREDYDDIVLPFIEQHRDAFPDPAATSFDAFCRAASWVASRAFCVDHWHGDSLVPFADVFNHKASLVVLGDQYRLDGVESSSDDEDGDHGDGDHDHDHDEDGGVGSSSDGSPHIAQVDGDGTTSPKAGSAVNAAAVNNVVVDNTVASNIVLADAAAKQQEAVAAMEAANEGVEPSLRLEIAICSIQEGDEDALEIVAAQSLKAGQEVHNTYGEHSNGQLLNKHGFTLKDNPFDIVEVPKAAVIAAAEQHLGRAAWQPRATYLQQQSALLDDDEEPMLLMAPHAVSLSLLVLLRAATMPDKEFSALDGVHELVPAGDCAKEDRWQASVDPAECMTPEMRRLLCTLCQQQVQRYPATLEANEKRWQELGGGRTPGHGPRVADEAPVANGEDVAAERAALGLRIGEQRILHNLLSMMLEADEPAAKRRCT